MTAPDFRADVDREQIAAALRHFEFVGGNTDNAIRIAINKTTPIIRTLASRKIRDQIRLQAAYVKGKLSIRKATRAGLSGAIAAEERGQRLTKYDTDGQASSDGIRWLRPPDVPVSGIRLKVKPAGGAKKLSAIEGGGKPFYMVLKDSRVLGIARRTSKDRKSAEVLYGLSVSQVYDDVRADVTPESSREVTRQMLDAMRYILQQRNPPEPPNE